MWKMPLLPGRDVDIIPLCKRCSNKPIRFGRIVMYPHAIHWHARQLLDAALQRIRQAGRVRCRRYRGRNDRLQPLCRRVFNQPRCQLRKFCLTRLRP